MIFSSLITRLISRRLAVALLAIMFFAPYLFCERTNTIPAPGDDLLQRIQSAHNIFISNAGGNVYWVAYDNAYSYEAMIYMVRQWPGYKVVGAPAEADLVFEISGELDYYGNQVSDITFSFRVIDPKTNQPLWSASTPIKPQGPFTGGDVHYAESFTRLLLPIYPSMKPIKKLPRLKKLPRPYPSQFATAKSVYFDHPEQIIPASPETTAQSEAYLYRAMVTTGKFVFADTPSSADLNLKIDLTREWDQATSRQGLQKTTQQVKLTILDPRTGVVLWADAVVVYHEDPTFVVKEQQQGAEKLVSRLEALIQAAQKAGQW